RWRNGCWRVPYFVEDVVALEAIVHDARAAANHHLLISEHIERKARARRVLNTAVHHKVLVHVLSGERNAIQEVSAIRNDLAHVSHGALLTRHRIESDLRLSVRIESGPV